MRIVFVTTYFYPALGGVEGNIFYLAKELVARGHEVQVVTSDRKESKVWKSEEVVAGIQVHRCRTWVRYGYYLAWYPDLLARLLRIKEVDVVHVHSLGFVWHDVCVMIYKLLHPRTRLVITPHGPFMTLTYARMVTLLKRFGDGVIRLVLGQYEKVIQVNPYQERWLRKQYGVPKRKIRLVPNGIPKEALTRKGDAKSILRRVRSAEVVLAYVGRLNAYKGVADVIRILPRLGKRVLFMVATSDHANAKAVQDLARELSVERQVMFVWDAREEEKWGVLDQSDIFIMPSQWEAFSIAMLEAMARRNAIVATHTEGALFLIRDGENGLVYNFGDVRQLEKDVLFLIEHKAMRRRMQERNAIRAKEFLWSRIVEQLEGVYTEQ